MNFNLIIFKFSVCVFFVVSSILSCQSQEIYWKNNIPYNSDTAAVREISRIDRREDVIRYRNLRNCALGLESIEQGYDGLQIRIWADHGIKNNDTTEMLLIRSNRKGDFSAVSYRFAGSDPGEFMNVSGRFISLAPKSGWVSFLKRPFFRRLFTIPDGNSLENYSLNTNPFGYQVEVAFHNNYRLYDYYDISDNIHTIPEAKEFVGILKMLDEEFSCTLIDNKSVD